jgi:hypothetical protein
LAELLDAQVRIADSSIVPTMCLNHGPTISIYYTDPDKNVIELFYDTAYSEEQIIEFYDGGDANAFGATPFDPADMLHGLQSGKPVAELIAWAPPSVR